MYAYSSESSLFFIVNTLKVEKKLQKITYISLTRHLKFLKRKMP